MFTFYYKYQRQYQPFITSLKRPCQTVIPSLGDNVNFV